MGGMNRVVERLVRGTGTGELDRIVRRLSRSEAPLRADAVAREVMDSVAGLGPLEVLLDDDEISDILVNGPADVWIERNGTLERTSIRFPDAAAIVAAVERMLLPLGLRLDRRSPAVDARLPDGSRLHAVVPPAAVDGPVVAIRRFTSGALSVDDLISSGTIDAHGAGILTDLVDERASLVVSGATGAGKTTMLNVLSRLVPAAERIVTIEEAAELDLAGHVVRLEARTPNAEGAGEITVRTLVRQALRMRPDRIVVGEVRGPEALDLIQAMSTGHAGSMGTVHAAGVDEALWRLETLAAGAGDAAPPETLRRMLRSSVDAVIHVERRGVARVVAAVARVEQDEIVPVWRP